MMPSPLSHSVLKILSDRFHALSAKEGSVLKRVPASPWTRALFRAASVCALTALTACDLGLLDVDDSGIIVPEDLERAGPAAIPTIVNGMVGDYHAAVSGIVRYSALLTDEMIAADNFPTRIEVDLRRIDPANMTLTTEMYTPLHRARFHADTTAFSFESHLDEPRFAGAEAELQEGIALARLYGGYTRLWLAEHYCQSILQSRPGEEGEVEPVLPADRMRDALSLLEEAGALAVEHGFAGIHAAALVGQARARLWLGEFAEAGAVAAQVPRAFVRWVEFSSNDPSQFNMVYAFTWGDTERIRWSIGDGTVGMRGHERWAHFEKFTELNLIRRTPPGFQAFNSSIPVNLQTVYDRPDRGILMASGSEARLIEAEVAVREGRTETAEEIVNDLRSDFSARAASRWGIETPPPGSELEPLSMTGNLDADLRLVAAERARELWLSGDRLTTARRLRIDPEVEVDLFPPVKGDGLGGGDDIAFPIVQRELDNNPHLGGEDACPVGQSRGEWH